jgi:transposase
VSCKKGDSSLQETIISSNSFMQIYGHPIIAVSARSADSAAIREGLPGDSHIRRFMMTCFVGLDVSQKMTALCVVDNAGRRLWRGQCPTVPEQIRIFVRRHAGDDARIGIETGAMTPWLVHELRNLGLEVVCLDARHARAALEMQINKTDQNDAEGLAQIVRTGWYRSVHVKSFDSHRARALLGARTQLVGMRTRLSNHIRGVLKTFGLLPGAMQGLPFDRKVEALVLDRSDVALIVRPMLIAWRQLREQITAFDKAIRMLVKSNSACRLLMSVPGIGVLSALAYVSTVEDPARFAQSRSVGAHLGLTPRQYQSGEVDRSGRISRCGDTLARTLLYEAAVVIMARVKRASSLKDWAQAIARRSGAGKARVALARKLSVILHSVWRSGQPFRWSEYVNAA